MVDENTIRHRAETASNLACRHAGLDGYLIKDLVPGLWGYNMANLNQFYEK